MEVSFVRSSKLYYFAIPGQNRPLPHLCEPHHSCGDPNAVVFTLFGGWFHSKFYPLGSTVDLCLYIACLIDHQRLQSGRRNSHRHASTRKSPKSKSQSQATPDKSAHIVKSLGCVTYYVARARGQRKQIKYS
jgi:hypothetical protein